MDVSLILTYGRKSKFMQSKKIAPCKSIKRNMLRFWFKINPKIEMRNKYSYKKSKNLEKYYAVFSCNPTYEEVYSLEMIFHKKYF